MVQSGIVKHPTEWEFSSYRELQNIQERKRKKHMLNGMISTLVFTVLFDRGGIFL